MYIDPTKTSNHNHPLPSKPTIPKQQNQNTDKYNSSKVATNNSHKPTNLQSKIQTKITSNSKSHKNLSCTNPNNSQCYTKHQTQTRKIPKRPKNRKITENSKSQENTRESQKPRKIPQNHKIPRRYPKI